MIEVLAPAGSYESLVAAVNAGADAVYMGASRFGARAYADNPDTDRFIDGLHYAHRYGAKVYMTVNTLFKNSELEELHDFLLPYYKEGVDAVLVQDLGALRLIREQFPDLPLHASTQMTVTDARSAAMAKKLGVCRVVPARELSLAEVRDIHEKVDVEIETFVYGALCYSYSGQCLMSSMIGGRSGNRGRCAQSCRLPYSCRADGKTVEGKLLSMKDLNALAILPELAQAGICSFKIEGRMKSPRYTAGVTSIWRKYVDRYLKMTSEKTSPENWSVDPKDLVFLSDLFDRGGTTEGYYHQHNGRDMMAWEEKKEPGAKEALYAYLDEKYVDVIKTVDISGHAVFRLGEPSRIMVSGYDKSVTVTGDEPMAATGRPMEAADLDKQLRKTGGTPYRWKALDIDADAGIFVPVSRLNDLRRRALEAFEKEVQHDHQRTM
jgi:U32 family peptidase